MYRIKFEFASLREVLVCVCVCPCVCARCTGLGVCVCVCVQRKCNKCASFLPVADKRCEGKDTLEVSNIGYLSVEKKPGQVFMSATGFPPFSQPPIGTSGILSPINWT